MGSPAAGLGAPVQRAWDRVEACCASDRSDGADMTRSAPRRVAFREGPKITAVAVLFTVLARD